MRVVCCLLVAPVVSRRPWEAGEEHREDRWRESVGSNGVGGGEGLLGVYMP